MADMELDNAAQGTPVQEPLTTDGRPVADEQSAIQEGGEQVADDSDESDAEPTTVSMTDFKALQSKMDKRYADLTKENETLKAKVATPPDGPTPEEKGRYDNLLSQYQQAQERAESTDDADEYAQAMYQVGALQANLIDAEATMVARRVGIDPKSPEFREALQNEAIESGRDIERIAWMVKAQATDEHRTSEALKEREKEMSKNEKSFDDRVKAEVGKQVAGLRQELGLNATAAVQPAGASGERAQLLREISQQKEAGNFAEVLNLKGILAQLAD